MGIGTVVESVSLLKSMLDLVNAVEFSSVPVSVLWDQPAARKSRCGNDTNRHCRFGRSFAVTAAVCTSVNSCTGAPSHAYRPLRRHPSAGVTEAFSFVADGQVL